MKFYLCVSILIFGSQFVKAQTADLIPVGPLDNVRIKFNYTITRGTVESARVNYDQAILSAKSVQGRADSPERMEFLANAAVQKIQTTTQTLTGSGTMWLRPPYHLVVVKEDQDLNHQYMMNEIANFGINKKGNGDVKVLGRAHISLPEFKADYEITTTSEESIPSVLRLQDNSKPSWYNSQNVATVDMYTYLVRGSTVPKHASFESYSTGTVGEVQVHSTFKHVYYYVNNRVTRLEDVALINDSYQTGNVVQFEYSDSHHDTVPSRITITHFSPNMKVSTQVDLILLDVQSYGQSENLLDFIPVSKGDVIKDERVNPPITYVIRDNNFPASLFGRMTPPEADELYPPVRSTAPPELPQSAPAARYLYILAGLTLIGLIILLVKRR